jgi:uncharacterized membrane protein (UPF0127 family)
VAHFLSDLVRDPGTSFRLRNERTGLTLATHVMRAFESRSRRTGLLGRRSLPHDAALVLAPCAAVHTAFMRFPIDVIFARRDGVVTKVCDGLRPWRVAVSLRAFAVIEVDAGVARRTGTCKGDRLAFMAVSGQHQTIVSS